VKDYSSGNSHTPSSEARLRALFELAPLGIIILDPETMLPLEFNRAAPAQLGYSAEEFARLRIADYEANEDLEDVQRHIQTRRGSMNSASDSVRHPKCAIHCLGSGWRIESFDYDMALGEIDRLSSLLREPES
jgi:PAS domain S-box-containing protein